MVPMISRGKIRDIAHIGQHIPTLYLNDQCGSIVNAVFGKMAVMAMDDFSRENLNILFQRRLYTGVDDGYPVFLFASLC